MKTFTRQQINRVKREYRKKEVYIGTNTPVELDDTLAINLLRSRQLFREFKDGWHRSHKMTPWRTEIRQPCDTPRFYKVRNCKKCGREQMYHAAGRFIDSGLKNKCDK